MLSQLATNLKSKNQSLQSGEKDEAELLIGHAVGGICPFAVNEDVEVYLDISLKRFQTVFPACGSSNSAIELSMEELEEYSDFIKWIDVCKIL